MCVRRRQGAGTWLPRRDSAPAKRACEIWFLAYGVFWIGCFGGIIATRIYDSWGHSEYFMVLGGLMLPLLLQPICCPQLTCDQGKPLIERYSFKANLWLLIFGFIGNYWYTHYFYTVLKASYSMKSWDLNGVPIPMYFAARFRSPVLCKWDTGSGFRIGRAACQVFRHALLLLLLPHTLQHGAPQGGDDVPRRLGALCADRARARPRALAQVS